MIKKTTIIFIILFILIFPATAALAKMVSVVGDNVNLRSGPGTKY